jgi:hypothetical protein
MTQPRDREIAIQARTEVLDQRLSMVELGSTLGLSVRQLQRRLYGEVAFTGAQLEALAVALGHPSHHFLAGIDGETAA